MAFVQVKVTAKALKDLVDQGKTIDEICEAFKDEKGNPLPKNTAKNYLKQCDLKLKKVRKSKFVLVNDMVSENQAETIVVGEEANV
jgi:mRNA-degrading endonuclease RelE of RelBE toxin-antitoxin system